MSLPGPGIYTKEEEFGKNAKSFTIGGKHKDSQKSEVPGPGHYEPSNTHTKDRSVAFGMG